MTIVKGIGETSPAMQAKLLRVNQEKEIHRVGGKETIGVDVLILTMYMLLKYPERRHRVPIDKIHSLIPEHSNT